MRVFSHLPNHLSQLLRWLAFGALLFVSAMVLFPVFWLSQEFDESARKSSHLMIESGLNAIVASNEVVTHHYAYWTEAFNAVRANNVNWLDENMGSGVVGTMNVAVIAGGPLSETLGWADEVSAHFGDVEFAAFRDAGFDLAARAEHNPTKGAISTFVKVDSTLWTVAIDWIAPHDRALEADESMALLVSAMRIDDATLGDLGEMFLIDGLTLVDASATIGGLESIAIANTAGTLGHLVWPAPRPGIAAQSAVAVPLVLALMLATATISFGTLAVSRLTYRLERALVAAEVADRTKSEFIATLSHELRTPMNGIVGILQLLQLDDLTEEQCELVALGLNSAENQVEMIDHLLAFGQIESGNLQLSTGPFEPGETMREVIALAMPSAREKALDLKLVCEGPVGTTLLGDRLAIRQIAVNLICNAIKFTVEGKVSVKLSVSPGFTGTRLRLAVSDTGPGIEEADIARIFDSFVQADSSATRKINGVGLGLAISQRLAKAMGGSLSVDSSPGRGATFVFEVTLETPVVASAIHDQAA